MLEEIELTCPYCGEAYTTLVDCSAGEQRYIEDCQVCCQPMELHVHVSAAGELEGVETFRDDD